MVNGKEKSILTKDILLRMGKVIKAVFFCGQDESIYDLFFQCSAARLIWSLLKCAFALNCTPTSLLEDGSKAFQSMIDI